MHQGIQEEVGVGFLKQYRITVDREGCLADAICTAMCGENWFMDTDGRASFRNETIEESEYECNMEAAKSCPTGIIKITGLK